MRCSVIIPTYNGAHKIGRLLDSLAQQTHPADEIIVVVDGSTDDTKSVLDAHPFVKAFPVKVHYQANGGRAKVRNTGASLATGDILIFLDDDMVLPAGCIAAHMAAHSDGVVKVVNGHILNERLQKVNYLMDYLDWANKRWVPEAIADPQLMRNPYISAANVSMLKSCFDKVGGFDERLNDAEDYDLAVRLQLQGVPMYIYRSAAAAHADPNLQSFKNYIHRLRAYQQSHAVLKSLKPELYTKHFQERQITVPTGLKGQLFKFFAKGFWVQQLEKHAFQWLPYALRMKLTDLIVTANGTYFVVHPID